MSNARSITEEFIRNYAANSSAMNNAKKISSSGGFRKLCKTDDEMLIFGDCYGSGSKPYNASVDFSGDVPVFRCSCPSRQIPCKHCLAIMYDWLAGKSFDIEAIPEDIARKREKIEKRAEKAASGESTAAAPKPNKSAAEKKLKKQREGLDLADSFVKDILEHGIGSVSKAACTQYSQLAKQLGDYYLPEPQAIMYEIIEAVQLLDAEPDDKETNKVIALCVRLSSAIHKSRDYIDKKLETGEVLPEDNILYEEMGGIWKLSQLRELGLYRENTALMQLAFTVVNDVPHKAEIDTGYWIDLDTGDIFRTENIRPYRAAKYIRSEDSSFDLYIIKELYLYPGSLNRRVRWEASEGVEVTEKDFRQVLSKADETISSAVKKAKNELKNTLSRPYAAVLIKFDRIEYAADGHGVLFCGEETISLRDCSDFPSACQSLKMLAGTLSGGAVFGGLFYEAAEHCFYFSPFSIVTENDIIRL
ncbi:MAG: SWIM zinc finger family protein [Ruminococcus sp.]|uniref:SWIM zinc finger family protein n=1 Tax=Ruminococcus sp. TaxID=41978 RepID=UPI0025F00789|nr:SWIM zinc finger family protein [Ruminococcus sp.]MCR4793778.1 SWIM zinc finger family protein [Ruminococcus sp.]